MRSPVQFEAITVLNLVRAGEESTKESIIIWPLHPLIPIHSVFSSGSLSCSIIVHSSDTSPGYISGAGSAGFSLKIVRLYSRIPTSDTCDVTDRLFVDLGYDNPVLDTINIKAFFFGFAFF